MSKLNNVDDLYNRIRHTEEVLQVYRMTKSILATASKMGISPSKVYNILISNGIELRQRGRPSKPTPDNPKPLTAEEPKRSYDG